MVDFGHQSWQADSINREYNNTAGFSSKSLQYLDVNSPLLPVYSESILKLDEGEVFEGILSQNPVFKRRHRGRPGCSNQ
jgi:hypothetical protein